MREKPPLRSEWRRVRGDAQGPVEICGTEISDMNIKGSTITGNKAASYGGGLAADSSARAPAGTVVSDTKTGAILVLPLSTKSRRMTGIEACHATAFIASIVLMSG